MVISHLFLKSGGSELDIRLNSAAISLILRVEIGLVAVSWRSIHITRPSPVSFAFHLVF